MGFVRDADGRAPLAGAQLVFESAALPGPQDAVTDAAGAFEVRLLPAGSYTVTVCRAGFDDFSQSNVPLRAGKTLKVTITLQRSTSAAKAKCGAMASRQS